MRRAIAALALAALLCACTELFAQFRDRVAIPTQEPPGPNAGCPDALAVGRLDTHPDWGVALVGDDGQPIRVIWPHGWYGREFTPQDAESQGGLGIEVVDDQGQVVARTGEVIGLGGGFAAGDASFTACSVVEVAES